MQRLRLIKQGAWLRDWLPVLATGLILAAGYPLFLHPLVQSAKASSEQRRFDALYAERLASMERMNERLDAQLRQLEEQQAAEPSSILTPAQAETFFAWLEQAALQTRCHLASVEYEAAPKTLSVLPNESRTVDIRAVKLMMYGTYDAWIQWFRQLESYPQSVLLDSLKIDSARERPGLLAGRVCLLVPIARTPDSQEPSPPEKSKEK
ncbi:MAG: hypothetical protein WHS88_05205 [Anaerohalosphaeraceae bacterium]